MFKNNYFLISLVLFVIIMGASVTSILKYTDIFGQSYLFAQAEKKEDPAETEKRVKIGTIMTHLKAGEYDLAIELAKEYLRTYPNDANAINPMADAYFKKGELAMAEKSVKDAIAIQPNNPWSYAMLATIYKTNDKLDLALEAAMRGLSFNPDDSSLLGIEAQIYAQQGDLEEARAVIDKALILKPNDQELKKVKDSFKEKEKTVKE